MHSKSIFQQETRWISTQQPPQASCVEFATAMAYLSPQHLSVVVCKGYVDTIPQCRWRIFAASNPHNFQRHHGRHEPRLARWNCREHRARHDGCRPWWTQCICMDWYVVFADVHSCQCSLWQVKRHLRPQASFSNCHHHFSHWLSWLWSCAVDVDAYYFSRSSRNWWWRAHGYCIRHHCRCCSTT